MNRIDIMGRLVRDPELKTTNNGTDVCSFTVAVDRFAKKGEEKQADFIDCVAWRQTAAFVTNYFKKGSGIVVCGRLESRKWEDKSGNKRVSWEVVCDNVYFPISSGNTSAPSAAPTFAETPEVDDGDLPF